MVVCGWRKKAVTINSVDCDGDGDDDVGGGRKP